MWYIVAENSPKTIIHAFSSDTCPVFAHYNTTGPGWHPRAVMSVPILAQLNVRHIFVQKPGGAVYALDEINTREAVGSSHPALDRPVPSCWRSSPFDQRPVPIVECRSCLVDMFQTDGAPRG